MRRRTKVIVLGGLVVVGAVAVFEARQPHRAHVDLATDEHGDAPPYPFPEPAPDPLETRLSTRKVTLHFNGIPVGEALEVLSQLAGVPIELDPRLAGAASKARVTLGVRDVSMTTALLLLVGVLGEDAVRVYAPSKVRIVPAGAEPPRPLWQRVSAAAIFASFRAGGEPEWVQEYKRRLALQKVTANFSETPLSEVVQFFQDLTGLNVTVDPSVDLEALKLSVLVREVPAGDLLAEVCAMTSLTSSYKNETIFLRPVAAPERAALLDRRVSLDLRGVKMPALVAALESQSVPVLASPEAWRGRGTFSVVLDQVPLEVAVAEIRSATGVHVAFLERPEALVAIHGAVPSIADALAAKCPAAWKGVKGQLADLHAELEQRVAERSALRASAARASLMVAERRVHDTVNEIVALSVFATEVEEAPERKAKLELVVANAKRPGDRAFARLDLKEAERCIAIRARLLAGARLRRLPDGSFEASVDGR